MNIKYLEKRIILIEMILDGITQHIFHKHCVSNGILKELCRALGLSRSLRNDIRQQQGFKQYTLFTNSMGNKGWIWRPPPRQWKCEKCGDGFTFNEKMEVMTYDFEVYDGLL